MKQRNEGATRGGNVGATHSKVTRMPAFATLRMLGVGLVLIGTVSAAAAPLGWQTYTFPDDGFAIDLPGAPAVSKETAELPVITHRQYQVDVGIGVYLISAKRYMPDARLDLWNEDSMVELANAMKGECQMRDAKPATFTGALAYEMVLDRCPGGTVMKVRMYVVRDRVYQLVAAGVTGVETRSETQKFHDSFKLIPVKQPPEPAQTSVDDDDDKPQEGRRSRAERRHHQGRVRKRARHRRDRDSWIMPALAPVAATYGEWRIASLR
jgi:hypothetical protein